MTLLTSESVKKIATSPSFVKHMETITAMADCQNDFLDAIMLYIRNTDECKKVSCFRRRYRKDICIAMTGFWEATESWLMPKSVLEHAFSILNPPRNMTKTKIYLIKNNRNGYYKIGQSTNPKIRERTLQSEDPDLKMIGCWNGCVEDEKDCHEAFRDKRIRGEWFRLTKQDVAEICESLAISEKTATNEHSNTTD